MTWSSGDALAIIIGLALLALVGGWVRRWAAGHQDQGDQDDDA